MHICWKGFSHVHTCYRCPFMLLGAHVSVAGCIARAVGRQLDIGGNCGQIFTHSPRVWRHTPIPDEDARRFHKESVENLQGPWVIHASYLVNLSTPNERLREKSLRSLQKEIDAAGSLGIPYVNVHLGAHTGAGEEQGLINAAGAIDQLSIPDDVTLLIETDAGSGTKLGGTFEHLAAIQEFTSLDVGFCLDTAHVFVAGYDLSTPQEVDSTVARFDDVVGLEQLKCIHLNDSTYALGSHRDVHAHIGKGHIGEAGMRRIVNHPGLQHLPFLLETPKETETSDIENIRRVQALRC